MFLSDLSMGRHLRAVAQIVQRSRSVIAAGGIADANGVAAAMALGAGVRWARRAAVPEAAISAVHRAARERCRPPYGGHQSVQRRPARGIMNRLMRGLGRCVRRFPTSLASSALASLRAKAEREGRGDFSPLWAGQNTTGCREIPAADLTRELARRLYERW
jgi:nitronate monooxygenase